MPELEAFGLSLSPLSFHINEVAPDTSQQLPSTPVPSPTADGILLSNVEANSEASSHLDLETGSNVHDGHSESHLSKGIAIQPASISQTTPCTANSKATEIARLKSQLQRTNAELKARNDREAKLIAKVLRLEQAIVVLQHQRDQAKTFGLAEHHRANAVHHVFYGTPCTVDALVIAALQPSLEPDFGENLEDLTLYYFSDHDEDMDSENDVALA